MSALWTPSGDQPSGNDPIGSDGPGTPPGAAGDPGLAGDEATARREAARVRAELAQTPVADIVANHAIGLWQLAVLHLGLEHEGAEPDLAQAKLALDAMASMVEGVVDRLDDHAEPLKQALTNLRLAYVNVSTRADPSPEDADP